MSEKRPVLTLKRKTSEKVVSKPMPEPKKPVKQEVKAICNLRLDHEMFHKIA